MLRSIRKFAFASLSCLLLRRPSCPLARPEPRSTPYALPLVSIFHSVCRKPVKLRSNPEHAVVHVPVIHNQGRVNPVICRGNVHLTAVDIQDTVAVQPSQFGLPPEQAITNELNKKYANRVLHDVGLCVCVFDLAEVGEGKVRYGDGCLWYKGW